MKKKRNIPKAFTGFLIASFFMWLLINLSKKYTSVLTYEVKYEALPQDKILKNIPLKEIDVEVIGSGFKLFYANFSQKKITFSLSKLNKKRKNNYYYLTNTKKAYIQKQLPSGLFINKVLQDSIHFNLGVLGTKKVPLKSNLDITYAKGFDNVGNVIIKPDSIFVSGSESHLAKLSELSLEKFMLNDVSEDVKKKLNIVVPKEMNTVNLSATSANLHIIVDKFTEGEFEVPIVIKESASQQNINIYPKTVKVFFKVGLKYFNTVQASSFKVVCDYSYAKNNELTYLTPKLVNVPKNVSSVRIIPNKIDFLIHK